MSRSLAPSPTATAWLTGIPVCAANRRSASAFPARSMTGPASWPVSFPSGDLQRVRGRVIDAQVGGEGVGDLGEPAADDPAAVAEPAQGADQGAGPGGEPQLRADLLQRGLLQAGQHGDPLPERGGEVELAAHGRIRDLGHLLGAAGPGGEQVDHLAGDERGVHVHHHQPHGPAVQPAGLHGDVHALLGGLPGQRDPERLPGRPRRRPARCRSPGGARAAGSGRCSRRWRRSARRSPPPRPGPAGCPAP